MNDGKMKAAIILASLAIVSLAASAMKVNQIIPVKRTNKLDLDHLIDAISVEIEGTRARRNVYAGWTKTTEAPRVAELLAKTEPKNLVHPWLKFSIDDLLKLNEWTVDDCNDAEFEKRRATCKQFFGEGRFRLGPDSNEIITKEDFVHYNIGKYCWEVAGDLTAKCPLARMEHAVEVVASSIGSKGDRALKSFQRDVKRHISQHEVPLGNWEFYNKAVRKVFAENSYKTELKKICKVLVEKLQEFVDADRFPEKWSARLKECSIVNAIQVDN